MAEHLMLLYRPENRHYAKIIGDFIKECQRKRPTGPDGKHGKLHTAECGCEDKSDVRCPTCQQLIWNARRGEWVGARETVDLKCMTCGRDYSQENPVPTIRFWEKP